MTLSEKRKVEGLMSYVLCNGRWRFAFSLYYYGIGFDRYDFKNPLMK